ncbi:MAG TPA: DUF1345 domain-containing protein [Stellaceae bacterium]|nr:DUF1345 domain-containing protein [Stellaceae bacterium]
MRFRDLHAAARLALAAVVGAAALYIPASGFGAALRGTLAWVVGVAAFLALTVVAIGNGSPERARARARSLDQSTWIISVIIVAAASVSLGALGYVLQKAAGPTVPRLVIAGLAVVASWLLVHAVFALHYAHAYYGDPETEGTSEHGGLDFPGHQEPDYWDFLYYALVVGMTCQVSDVQVTSRKLRRMTLAHGVLAFIFNTGVLALAVNIIASAL